jgi:hypothetical protein
MWPAVAAAAAAAAAEDHPELSFGEVGRKLGELWKALSEEDKKGYSGERLRCLAH